MLKANPPYNPTNPKKDVRGKKLVHTRKGSKVHGNEICLSELSVSACTVCKDTINLFSSKLIMVDDWSVNSRQRSYFNKYLPLIYTSPTTTYFESSTNCLTIYSPNRASPSLFRCSLIIKCNCESI